MPIKNINFKNKICKTCNKEFKPTNPRKLYCSEKCKRGVYICKTCNEKFWKKGSTTGKYCSMECWYKESNKSGREEKKCPTCKKMFIMKYGNQKTCSKKCADISRRKHERNKQCLNCDKILDFYIKPSRKFCSRSCSASYRHGVSTKVKEIGSKRVHNMGYIEIKTENGWMLEHRYNIEKNLNRKLESFEHVHHINGDKTDNKVENLELWDKTHPSGIRISDYHCSGCICNINEIDEYINKSISNLIDNALSYMNF